MLDFNYLRHNLNEVAQNLKNKGFILDITQFEKFESSRKILQVKMQDLQATRNHLSKQIGVNKSQGKDVMHLLSEVAQIGDNLSIIEVEFNNLQKEFDNFLAEIPNILHDSVPIGSNESFNKVVRTIGVIPNFEFQVKDHVDLGYLLNKQIDFELGSKLSGSRFYVLKNKIAKLHRALTQFMLDVHTNEHGYIETYVPYIVKPNIAFGTGQLPKFTDDFFKTTCGNDDGYLISTAEISVTNFVTDMVLTAEQLPLKFVAHTPCFRSEAGSYGKDTRGMIRVHQFDKVELVQIVAPNASNDVLEELTSHAENILKKLKLPYQVVQLCSGDTGFASSKTYDLEVWIPSQNTYREISSCSLMTDFQARRMKARVKNIFTNNNEYVHTLNGSGLAVGRTLVAILENYQNSDGSITVPDVLLPYMGMSVIN